jgi:hypothetical protein
MNFFFSVFMVAFLLMLPINSLAQSGRDVDIKVIPPTNAGTAGNSTFLGPLANAQRTYQLLIHESLLTDLVNKEIQAISWRIPTSATANWPTADVVFAAYDIYLSGSVAPADRNLTFADNIVGPQTQVRSGPLTVRQDEYTFGNVPNDFGPEIVFNNLWLYTGGHLLIEIRHQGFTGTSRSVDALSASTTPAYGIDFSACWTGNYAGTSGTQGNFSIVKLTYDDPIPVELTSFTASASGNNVFLNWSTASETNNQGFDIQRKSLNSDYESVGFVTGFGTTTEARSYSFTDEVAKGTYTYRLKQLDFDGSFEYSSEIEVDVNIPSVYSLEQNYPNPFNPSTTINFSLANEGFVKLAVYNTLGQEVITLVNEVKESGAHSVTFDASVLTSGAYFYKLETAQFSQTKKMLLTK